MDKSWNEVKRKCQAGRVSGAKSKPTDDFVTFFSCFRFILIDGNPKAVHLAGDILLLQQH